MENDKSKEIVNNEESKFTFLYMKQVPKRTAEEFVSLASEEFSGHFGFCLKALLDQMVVIRNTISEERLEALEEEVSMLRRLLVERKPAEEPVKSRRSVAGTPLKEKKENGGMKDESVGA